MSWFETEREWCEKWEINQCMLTNETFALAISCLPAANNRDENWSMVKSKNCQKWTHRARNYGTKFRNCRIQCVNLAGAIKKHEWMSCSSACVHWKLHIFWYLLSVCITAAHRYASPRRLCKLIWKFSWKLQMELRRSVSLCWACLHPVCGNGILQMDILIPPDFNFRSSKTHTGVRNMVSANWTQTISFPPSNVPKQCQNW